MGTKGGGCTYLLGEAVLSYLFPRWEKEGPGLTQKPVVQTSSCSGVGEGGGPWGPRCCPSGWGRLVDHGVPGAAPQVGPRRSQLYPLPKTFVFLILCLLIFLIQKIKIKPRALWNKVWGWVRGGLREEAWLCFQEGCSERAIPVPLLPHPFPLRGCAEPAKSPPNSNPALAASITSAAFVHGRRHEKQPVAGGLGKHHRASAPETRGDAACWCLTNVTAQEKA